MSIQTAPAQGARGARMLAFTEIPVIDMGALSAIRPATVVTLPCGPRTPIPTKLSREAACPRRPERRGSMPNI